MIKISGKRVFDGLTFTCKAISPSERFTYQGSGNYEIFPDKQGKPAEQATEEVDIRTEADRPTKIELSGKRNPYKME